MSEIQRVKSALLPGVPWAWAVFALAGTVTLMTRSLTVAAPRQDASAPARTVAQESTEVAQQDDLVTLPVGTTISVRLADTVDSNHNHTGQQFSGTVDPSVLVGDGVVIPRGTEAHLRLMVDKKGGRIHAHAEVRLELISLILNGRRLDVDSSAFDKKKGVLAAKVKAEAEPSAKATAGVALAGDPSGVGGPMIAAFRAAKVVKAAGSKIDFRLVSPFTFAKPKVNATP